MLEATVSTATRGYQKLCVIKANTAAKKIEKRGTFFRTDFGWLELLTDVFSRETVRQKQEGACKQICASSRLNNHLDFESKIIAFRKSLSHLSHV